jgi:hypothetical protein
MGVTVGADKFVHLLGEWQGFLAPALARLAGGLVSEMMLAAGVVEILVGLAVLTRWTRSGAFVMAAWLAAITANLVLAGLYDIAVRDLVLAFGALALGLLAAPGPGRAEAAS